MDKKKADVFMARTIELAEKAAGRTSPNPKVGAVIVKGGRIIGEGYHKRAGGDHAEILALRKAGSRAKGADLFVNLEPCCHYGKTPPCTDSILKSGIKRVYIGMRDPNQRVAGKGIRILEKNGLQVVSGILRNRCMRLNETFNKYIQTKLPFVILKSAVSLDGKIATRKGESRWITGEPARQYVHSLRDQNDAILVGAGTVLKDDPLLTTRLKNGKGKNPIRVIVDYENRVSIKANVFKNSDRESVVYVTSRKISLGKEKQLHKIGVDICKVRKKKGGFDFKQLLKELGNREITSLLIEGGSQINASALCEGIVDKVVLFIAPIFIGGNDAPGVIGGEGIARLKDHFRLREINVTAVGRDIMVEGYL